MEKQDDLPVRVAIIGLGRIASLLEDDEKREKPASHAGAFSVQPGCAIVAGCDTDADRRTGFGKRWKVAALYEDPRIMLQEQKPDILVVATYPDSHPGLVRAGLDHQVPVIVCEKPLADNLASARRIVREAAASRSLLMVNHERRYARDYRRVKTIIDDGRYGALRSIGCKLYMGRNRTPGEVLLWDGTHLVDILRFLTGAEIRHPQCWGKAEAKAGLLQVRLDLVVTPAGGKPIRTIPATIEIATDRDHLVFELDLGFETGRVRVGNGLYEEWQGGVSPLYDKMRSLLPVAVDQALLQPSGYFAGMAADAVSLARARRHGAMDGRAVSSGQDGLAALAAIDAILRRAGSSLDRIAHIQ